MALKLHGIIPPIATPMHPDGSLNLDAVPALVEHLIAGGVHGIFSPGSQGEAFALSMTERLEVIAAVLKAVNGRVPVLAGTGTITTRDSIKLTQEAERLGVDAMSIITPYFISPSQDELYAHYAEIAAAVSTPILAYSNPGRTGGVKIAPSTLARLAKDIPHFIGVKDSGGDLSETATIIRLCPPDFQVFVGRDTLVYGGLCYGAVGAVVMTGNVLPALLVGIYDAFMKGDHACARELQAKLAIFRDAVPHLASYPAPIKEALNLIGLNVGPSRKPIQPLSDSARAELRNLLQQMGIEVVGP
jgi:4-hydroxy-tetrahydrodipicolinate synthase